MFKTLYKGNNSACVLLHLTSLAKHYNDFNIFHCCVSLVHLFPRLCSISHLLLTYYSLCSVVRTHSFMSSHTMAGTQFVFLLVDVGMFPPPRGCLRQDNAAVSTDAGPSARALTSAGSPPKSGIVVLE